MRISNRQVLRIYQFAAKHKFAHKVAWGLDDKEVIGGTYECSLPFQVRYDLDKEHHTPRIDFIGHKWKLTTGRRLFDVEFDKGFSEVEGDVRSAENDLTAALLMS